MNKKCPVCKRTYFSGGFGTHLKACCAKNWQAMLKEAPEDIKKTPAFAILRSQGVYPISLKGNTICLTFRYLYHKEMMEKTENKEIAKRLLSHCLGGAYNIHCIYKPDKEEVQTEMLESKKENKFPLMGQLLGEWVTMNEDNQNLRSENQRKEELLKKSYEDQEELIQLVLRIKNERQQRDAQEK